MIRSLLITALGIPSLLLLAPSEIFAARKAPPPPPPVIQGEGLPETSVPAAYNYPASIQTGGTWDYFFNASFLYWYASEEFLQVGARQATRPNTETEVASSVGTMFEPDFAYHPGFKFGFGINTPFDHWTASTEWTRLSGAKKTTFPTLTEFQAWDDFWVSGVFQPKNLKWNFYLNLFDLSVSRPAYQGTRLTISPVLGIRGILFKQDIRYEAEARGEFNQQMSPIYKSKVWGIGPRLGADLNWLLYKGFRLIGFGSGSLLYARYVENKIKGTTGEGFNITQADLNPSSSFEVPAFSALRVNLESHLGFGWGTYCYSNRYHVDFTATYDFQGFFKMNVMSAIVPSWTGDVFFHGLTFTGKFDF